MWIGVDSKYSKVILRSYACLIVPLTPLTIIKLKEWFGVNTFFGESCTLLKVTSFLKNNPYSSALCPCILWQVIIY